VNPNNNEDDSIDMKSILSMIIFVTIFIIFLFSYIVYDEISSAKRGCEILNGTYKLDGFMHKCNNHVLYKYSNGIWGFKNDINWSNLNITIP